MHDIEASGYQAVRNPSHGRRALVAASVGNVLEIYDFIAYGIFAIPISHTFFPSNSEFTALVLTFLTFAAGFLVRPIGALVLGRYADRVGRRRALSLTLILMAGGTVVPAVCPSFASIGVIAPLIVVLGRLLQGFSAGGEIGGTVAMMIEAAPPARKCFYASFQQTSQGCGVLLAGLIGLLLTQVFTASEMAGGAWRIAFAFGLLIGPVGWYVRRSVPETSEFEKTRGQARVALLPALIEYRGRLLMGVSIMVFWTIATYVSNYFTTYAVRELKLSSVDSYIGQLAYGITMVVVCPIVGAIADRIGTRKPMLYGAAITAAVAYPLFVLLAHDPSRTTLIAVQMTIALLLACYAACASAVLASVFPTQFRATGVAFTYAVGVTLFGGFTPAVVTMLIGLTGDKLVVGYYLAAAALISCIPLLISSSPRNGIDSQAVPAE